MIKVVYFIDMIYWLCKKNKTLKKLLLKFQQLSAKQSRETEKKNDLSIIIYKCFVDFFLFFILVMKTNNLS